jgi:oxygen-dependent protoporphyrinogen oxidase
MVHSKKTIVVVGAGLAGLTSAWKLQNLLPSAKIIVVEGSDRAGGILQTHSESGYVVDLAADMFTTNPNDALGLCFELGKDDDLLTTTPVAQRAYVATEESIEPVPRGFSLMLPANADAIRNTKILDREGIQRMLDEVNVPPFSTENDEDFQSFVVRRFGQQAFDRLVQPLVSGIYTADPCRLSMNATMRRFVDMERSHGSLIAASRDSDNKSADREASGARYDLFRAPREGMNSLIRWLVNALKEVDVRFNWPVDRIEEQSGKGWLVYSKQSDLNPVEADAVILATPVSGAASILSTAARKLSDRLSTIQSASCAVVVLAFDQRQLRRSFEGYGIVVPAILKRQLIAASFASNKFPGRAPGNKVLIRCFIGGAMQGELVDLSDRQLTDLAITELDRLIGIDGTPDLDLVCRWKNAMPQYHVGHLDLINSIDDELESFPSLALAGNAYRGVGIPVCVRSGIDAAVRIAQTDDS